MRVIWTTVAMVILLAPRAWAQTPAPPQVPALNTTGTPDVTLTVNAVSHALEVASAAVVTIGTAAVVCEGGTPASCPTPPVVGAFVDSTTAWSAARLEGRVLVVRNAGPGVLTLRAEDLDAAPAWRLQTPRMLAAGESVMLVYDATAQRWHALGVSAGSGGNE